MTHSLKAQLADALAGQPPVVHTQSHYALNLHGGVTVDVLEFEAAVTAGHRFLSQGSTTEAIGAYDRAVALYGGDLAAGSDISELLERERLRATCLTTLARLADAHFELANYEPALESALRLLMVDPCREDAHRMVMRAHVRLGSRAQALRQYKLCRVILQNEFDAAPEPATERLFNPSAPIPVESEAGYARTPDKPHPNIIGISARAHRVAPKPHGPLSECD